MVQLGNCLQTDKLRDRQCGKRLASTSAGKFSELEFSDTIQRWKLFYRGLWSFSCLQTPESLRRASVYCHCIACFTKTFASTILLSWAPSKLNAHSQKSTAFSTHCCDYIHRRELQTRWEKGLIHCTGMALNLNRLSCSRLLFGWKLLLLPFLVFQRRCPAGWECWEVPAVGMLHAPSVFPRTELGLCGIWVLDHGFPWCWGALRGNIPHPQASTVGRRAFKPRPHVLLRAGVCWTTCCWIYNNERSLPSKRMGRGTLA